MQLSRLLDRSIVAYTKGENGMLSGRLYAEKRIHTLKSCKAMQSGRPQNGCFKTVTVQEQRQHSLENPNVFILRSVQAAESTV